MHRIALPTVLVVALATAASAQVSTHYLHRSAAAVAVPGGTSLTIVDETPPTAAAPVVESISVPKGSSQSFSTFVAPAFGSPATIGLDFDAVVHVSANLAMTSCAEVGVAIERVDAAGAHTTLTLGSTFGSIPQGGFGGESGFVAVAVPVSQGCDRPLGDENVGSGESFAVRVSITNWCNANRTVTLAYDATSAPGSITFAPVTPPDPAFTRACFGRCETVASRATAKLWSTKGACVTKCQAAARRGAVPLADCFPPYGGAASTCIADPFRGAEARVQLEIVRGCTPAERCPPCYAGGDCEAYAPAAVQLFEGTIDAFLPGIYCESTTNKRTARCQDRSVQTLAKLFAQISKCYDYCFASERRQHIPPGSCRPVLVNPDTIQCIESVRSKAITTLDRGCFAAPAAAPACWGGATATDWADLTTITQAGTVDGVYCGD